MIRLALLLIALGGCDKLFDLDHISSAGARDGGTDTIVTMDGPQPCAPLGHDEDLDGIDDACDGCPDIPSTDTDTDGDGLPDMCDRDDSPTGADQIVAYWTFGTDQRTDFMITGVVSYSTTGNGYLMLNGGSSLTTTQPFVPTRVELHLSMTSLTDYTADLQIQTGAGTVCHFRGANCGMTMGGIQGCIMYGANVFANWPATPTGVRRYSLFRENDTTLTCDIGVGPPTGTTATGLGAFNANTVGVAVTTTGTTRLEALVIYGAK